MSLIGEDLLLFSGKSLRFIRFPVLRGCNYAILALFGEFTSIEHSFCLQTESTGDISLIIIVIFSDFINVNYK